MTLQIDKIVEDGVTVFRLSGDLDSMTAGELETLVRETVAAEEPSLVFDMAGLRYVSSFGLRVIVYAAKAMRAHGDRFVLHSVQEDVLNVLRIVGFESFLKIADDAPGARAAIGS